MLTILHTKRLQRVLVLRGEEVLRVLGPGWHVVWTWNRELIRYTLAEPVQAVETGDPLPADAPGQRVITIRDGERALVLLDGVQANLLAPGRYRIWDGPSEVEVRRIDRLARPRALADEDIVNLSSNLRIEASTSDLSVAVLYRNGSPVEALPKGRYRVWSGGPWALASVSLALRSLAIAPQDLLTRDQVPVRVKPQAPVRVRDPLVWLFERTSADVEAYTAVQLALREEAAGRTLDELLADRDALGPAVLKRARALLPDVGLALQSAAVKDIILPGEVKDLLGKVTLARKEAEAQALRRREEVATTRQLANTAKLLEKNPVLTRLEELEALGDLLGKVHKVTLVGTGDLVRDVISREVRES